MLSAGSKWVCCKNVKKIEPGEGYSTKRLPYDENCEELAFPQYFSKGKFGYTTERDTKLTPVKYFNEHLLTYKQQVCIKQWLYFLCISSLTRKEFQRSNLNSYGKQNW